MKLNQKFSILVIGLLFCTGLQLGHSSAALAVDSKTDSKVDSADNKKANSSHEKKSNKTNSTKTDKKSDATVDAKSSQNPVVEMTTNMGKIVIELNAEKAPKTVENFLSYVKSGFYNGTIFHRVIDGFMIQGGGFTKDMKEKDTKAPIKNEADNGLGNEVGTIAMARTQDPDSASAQFFINVTYNQMLNHRSKTTAGWGYAVFGKVIEGMDVVNKIKSVKTASKGMYDDVPVEPVIIEKVILK